MKKLIVFSILLAAILLSAVNPFPAKLTVWNKTDNTVFIRLSYHNVQKYFLTVTDVGNTETYQLSVFEVVRKLYDSETTACGVTAVGTLDMNQNVKLNFTECIRMNQWWKPLYWGEPGMEKPNFSWEFERFWQLFQYEIVD